MDMEVDFDPSQHIAKGKFRVLDFFKVK